MKSLPRRCQQQIDAALAAGEATERPRVPGTHTLLIPDWLPPRSNEWVYRHWRVKARLTNAAEQVVGLHARQQQIPKATGRRSVALLVTLGPRRRQGDADSFDKCLLDVLVRCGLLLDDSARGLVGRMAVSFERGPQSATRITLIDEA